MKIITYATVVLDTTKTPSESVTLRIDLQDVLRQRDIILARNEKPEGVDIWLIHPMPPMYLYGVQAEFKIGGGENRKEENAKTSSIPKQSGGV